mmetsp:Transcript_57478/g.140927  ORF Transcript_57478/g.140927 Transcript_57478/m.140927 type:complete len:845 (-) Transcript_57478:104-2638(-)
MRNPAFGMAVRFALCRGPFLRGMSELRGFDSSRGPFRRGMSEIKGSLPLPQKRIPSQILIASHDRGRVRVAKKYDDQEAQSGRAQPATWVQSQNGLQYRGGLSKPGVKLDTLEHSLEEAGYKYLAFEDLQENKVHLGGFVIFRQVARPWKEGHISMLVEDLDGTLESALLHNFISPLHDSVPDASFACPLHSVFLVLEPCFVSASKREAWHLRIVNPSLVVTLNDVPSLPRLDESRADTLRKWLQPLPKDLPLQKALEGCLPSAAKREIEPSASEVRELGDALLHSDRFLRAAMTHTLVIERTHLPALLSSNNTEEVAKAAHLFAARAQALLALDENLLASRDAEKASALARCLPRERLTKSPSLALAMLTWARALFNLNDISKALHVLEESKGILAACMHKSDAEFQAAEMMRKRLAKMLPGNSGPKHVYNLKDMLVAHNESSPRLGEMEQNLLPNYVNPALRVGVSSAKGGARGLFAAQDIPAGTLISATRPIGFSLPVPSEWAPFEASDTAERESRTALSCKYAMLQSVLAGGRAATAAEWLCADMEGEELGVCTEIDLLSESLKEGGRDWKNEPWADVGALFDKATASMFDIDPLSAPSTGVPVAEAPVGMFGLSSLYNHACTPSASRFFLGDFMLITTLCPITSGAEVTIDYHSAFSRWLNDETTSKEAEVEKYWGFKCTCPLCDARRTNPSAFAEAKRMVQKVQHESKRKSPDKELAESLLEQMRSLSPFLLIQGEDPFLAHMLFMQARIAGNLNDKDKSLSLFEESFAVCAEDTPLRMMFRPILPAKMQLFSKALKFSKRVKESKAVAQQARQLLLRHSAGSAEIAKAMHPDLAGLL